MKADDDRSIMAVINGLGLHGVVITTTVSELWMLFRYYIKRSNRFTLPAQYLYVSPETNFIKRCSYRNLIHKGQQFRFALNLSRVTLLLPLLA